MKESKMKISTFRNTIGKFFMYIGFLFMFIRGFLELIICLKIIDRAAGFWGTLVAFFVFPVTILFVPIWEIIAHHNWYLFKLGYGGIICVAILIKIGYLPRTKSQSS
jgi:hypothetical protein